MANVTIPGELLVMFTVDETVTYESIEDALVDQGFEDYTIGRSTYPGHTDITITLRPSNDNNGTPIPFPAADTLTKLGTAAGAFTTNTEEEPPQV